MPFISLSFCCEALNNYRLKSLNPLKEGPLCFFFELVEMFYQFFTLESETVSVGGGTFC